MRRYAYLVLGLIFSLALVSSKSEALVLDLPFTLSKPAGNGPFPAVVILHDCSGLGPRSSGAPRRWAADLVAEGYVTLIPDSFSPRDHPAGVCARPPGDEGISYEERRKDAYAALAYLQSLPFVEPHRIAVMGGSHGGSSTLATIVDVPAAERPTLGFAAAIALYPNCGYSFHGWSVTRAKRPGRPIIDYSGVFKPTAPLLILIGEEDDWTPVEPCYRLVETARQAGHPVELKIYPGAHHAFDSPAPIRYLRQRRNINAPAGRGATTGGHPAAWADARRTVHRFLARHFAKEAAEDAKGR